MKVFILTRKRLAALSAALALVVCIGAAGAHRSELSVAVNAGGRRVPIYSVKTEEKRVSLSFDAAWGNEQTQELLDILKKNDVHSTFFLVGDWVRNYPDDVKRIAQAGHDVGNHSNTHPYMTKLGGDEMKSEIETCSADIEALTGSKPTLFRPPYGDYNNSVVDTVNGLGLYCVQWSIDSLDWQDPSPDEILAKVKDNLAPGAIILMHNGAKNTPAALPSVIEYIKSQGYEIVPVSELLPKGEYTTDANGAMIPKEEKAVKTAAEVESRPGVSSQTASATQSGAASGAGSSMTSSRKDSIRGDMAASGNRSGAASGAGSSMTSSRKDSVRVDMAASSGADPKYSGLAGEMYDKAAASERPMKK